MSCLLQARCVVIRTGAATEIGKIAKVSSSKNNCLGSRLNQWAVRWLALPVTTFKES